MKKLNLFIITFEVTLFSAILFLLLQMHLLDSELYTSAQNKAKMLKVADELKQSSDDLTRFARTYIATNDKLYYEQYFSVLGIRNGEIPRPLHYDSQYWYLDKDLQKELHPDTEKKSLKDIIKELPFSIGELKKLHSSEKNSNNLVNLEVKAFEAMNENPPNQKYAIELLYSNDYYEAKHEIMHPLDEFMHMLNERLDNNLNEIEEKIDNNFILFLVILFIFIMGNIILYKLMQKSLLEEIKSEVEKNRKKDQQMLAQSRLAQMGEMLSMIAHQWRQPLSTIAMGANNILIDIEFENLDEKTLRDDAKTIVATTMELSKTVDDFRYFYKPNKKSEMVKLGDVIDKAIKIIKPSLINHNVNVIKEYNSDEEMEIYDRELMQVILNLLHNAKENFKEKQIKNRDIIIKTENRTISVCDSGKGIPEDIIDKIFDPYFSTKKEKNGTGLGLYMSKTIIEEHHNGKLNVYNTDDGTCFVIELGIIPIP